MIPEFSTDLQHLIIFPTFSGLLYNYYALLIPNYSRIERCRMYKVSIPNEKNIRITSNLIYMLYDHELSFLNFTLIVSGSLDN